METNVTRRLAEIDLRLSGASLQTREDFNYCFQTIRGLQTENSAMSRMREKVESLTKVNAGLMDAAKIAMRELEGDPEGAGAQALARAFAIAKYEAREFELLRGSSGAEGRG